MSQKKTAIVSVYDKRGVVKFCEELVASGWSLLSTGGTEKALKDANVPVTAVSDATKFPEILGGRVKTLHPLVRFNSSLLPCVPYTWVGPWPLNHC